MNKSIKISYKVKKDMEAWEDCIERLKGKQRREAISHFIDRYKVPPRLSQDTAGYLLNTAD